MDSDQGLRKSGRRAPIIIVGIAAFVVAFAAAYIRSGGPIPGFTTSRVSATTLASQLEDQPGTRETFGAIRTHYPAEYRTLLERLAEVINRQGETAARREAFALTRQLMGSKFSALSRAPASDLQPVAQGYATLAHALQASDVNLCAEWARAGFSPASRPPATIVAQMDHLGALQLGAAHAGEVRPMPEPRRASDEDRQAFVAAVRSADPASAALFQDEAAFNAASPAQQCQVGVVVYDSAASLGGEAAANVIVEFLRDTFAPAAAPVKS